MYSFVNFSFSWFPGDQDNDVREKLTEFKYTEHCKTEPKSKNASQVRRKIYHLQSKSILKIHNIITLFRQTVMVSKSVTKICS